MLELLKDLYRHMEWADAAQWGALLAHPAARSDGDLKVRFLHIHGAQEVWLGRWQGLEQPLRWPTLEDYPKIEDLRHYGAACHVALRAYLPLMSDRDLLRDISFHTLAGERVTQNLGDTLMQLPMHSQYHRGQNASRMVALGAHMPATDWVLWARRGRPAPQWTSEEK